MQQTFEQILEESGYSTDQVRNIANQLAANRAKKGGASTSAAESGFFDNNPSLTPQTIEQAIKQ